MISQDKVEKYAEKYEDWWAEYNVTSRLSIFIFISLYGVAVIYILLNPINSILAQVILNTTGYISLISILVIILGPNTVVKIAEILNNKKFKDLTSKLNSNITSNNTYNIQEKTPKLPKDEL